MKTYGIRYQTLAYILLLGVYLFFSLKNLDTLPTVYEDEPFIASTGWKIATEGKFGTDLFTGFYGIENHVFLFPPVYPLLLGGVFHLIGIGLFQARLFNVLLGAITLILTYKLGSRLFHPTIGSLAIFFLLFSRLTGTTPSQITGILFVDIVRIVRYDLSASFFGLLALHIYLSADRKRLLYYAIAGLVVGIASLSHLYGGFWLVILSILVIFEKNTQKKLAALISGFILSWIPYIFYVLNDLPNWQPQTWQQAPRLNLLNLQFYINNILSEYHRYGPGLGPFGEEWLLRIGFWSTLILLPVSCLLLLKKSILTHDLASRVVITSALIFPILFAIFSKPKMANYLICIYPIWAICWAWGVNEIWTRMKQFSSMWPRYTLAILLILIGFEGISRFSLLQTLKNQTIPYPTFIQKIQSYTPANATILGSHSFWFGFEAYEYRAWALPIFQTSYLSTPTPILAEEAMDALSPDIILIDSRTLSYLESPSNEMGPTTAFLNWMEIKGYSLTTIIDDPTYGKIEIYNLATKTP
ncbi:MAG: glycosyltransferase family 39 protein [Anaerolineales bacterium]|nr:glycosyltransferase family 39 protein [Anaerolineales bacterium]